MMKRSIVFKSLAVLNFCFISSHAFANAQYFANEQGIVVKMVPSPVKGRFAVEISGTRSELDERPLELIVDKSDPKEFMYIRKVMGKSKFVLTQRSNGPLQVIVPGGKNQFLSFRPKESGSVNAESIINRVYFRPAAADAKVSLKSAIAQVNSECGATIVGESKLSAGSQDEKDVEGFCSEALRGVSELCLDALGKSSIKSGLKSFVCELGSSTGVEFAKGQLKVKFQTNTPSLAEEVSAVLEEKL